MALNHRQLQSLIITHLQEAGFTTTGEHAYAQKLAAVIAQAVVEHITEQAQVQVTKGSSAGIYSIT